MIAMSGIVLMIGQSLRDFSFASSSVLFVLAIADCSP